MKPTQILRNEHKIIKQVLAAISRLSQDLTHKRKVKIELTQKVMDFIRNYADLFHQGKEEDILFRDMKNRGLPTDYGPLGVVFTEHEIGRAYIRQVLSALQRYQEGETEAVLDVAKSLSNYVELLNQHIDKEDSVLYQMADEMFTATEYKKMVEEFSEIERTKLVKGSLEKCIRLAKEIRNEI